MIQLTSPHGPGFPGCQGVPDVSGLCGLAGLGDGVALNWVLIAVAPFMVWAVFRFKRRKSVSICVLICGSTIILFMLSRSAKPQISAINYETVYYYHNDHLGTPKVITDLNADIAWEGIYEPFGTIFRTTTERVSNPFRFPGQYEDDLTGMYYNINRYYLPSLGRYNRVDPLYGIIISSFKPSHPFLQTLHRNNTYSYIYSLNNPIINFDINGLQEKCRCEKIVSYKIYYECEKGKNYDFECTPTFKIEGCACDLLESKCYNICAPNEPTPFGYIDCIYACEGDCCCPQGIC